METELKTEFNDPNEFLNSFIGNISRGGLLIKTDNPLKVHDEFRLKFNIEGMERTFESLCKVMWIQELYDKYIDKLIPTMGCKFLELSPGDLETIEKFIKQKLKMNS